MDGTACEMSAVASLQLYYFSVMSSYSAGRLPELGDCVVFATSAGIVNL